MSLLEELRKKLNKLYNIDELCMLEFNYKLKCFRLSYEHTIYDEDYGLLSGLVDRQTGLRFIEYAMPLVEKDNYTYLQMNEVLTAWLYVNELEVL